MFLQTDRQAAVIQHAPSWAVTLPALSNDSRLLAKSAAWCLRQIFRREHAYKKAGVMLFGLCRRGVAQTSMFDPTDPVKAHRLMTMMDAINREHGRGSIRLASTAPLALGAGRTWHLRSDHRSPRYTTRWDELPVAVARGDL